MTAAFNIESMEDKRELKTFLDLYRIKDYKDTPLLDNLDKICEIIARSY